jgi:hypothetical protein
MAREFEQCFEERVERGRALLAESEEHRGSTDLQVRRAGGRQAAGGGLPAGQLLTLTALWHHS